MARLDRSSIERLVLGEYLGEGVSRQVFAYRPDPDTYVVKVQKEAAEEDLDFQNIAEWTLWCEASGPLKELLAPCYSLSPCGGALIQWRAETPCPTHLIPKRLPKVLGDLHRANFGVLEGRVVVTDYGRSLAYRMAANTRVMRKVNLDARTSFTTRS